MENIITFCEKTHTYWLGSVKIPGVSEIIEGVGLMDAKAKQFYTQFHSDRGTAVHAATVMIDNGTLDESSVDPEIVGYLEAYKKFKEEGWPQWSCLEYSVFNKTLFYAGTLDRFGTINKELVVVDIKTGQKAKWHAIQLAFYCLALIEVPLLGGLSFVTQDIKLCGLYLNKKGTYKLVDYTDPEIFKVAEACVRLFHWRQK